MDKGLLFFYDWEECFDSLNDKECKTLLLSMLRFKKYGTPPPEFTGVCKVIASLLFPQIERQIKDFENGKKGGRPKKETSSNNINKEENPYSHEQNELVQAALSKKGQIDSNRADRQRLRGDWAVQPKW